MKATATLLLLGACGGSSHAGPDSGLDAGIDAAVDLDAAPTGCEAFTPDGDRACVPSGSFWFGWVDNEDANQPCQPDGEIQYYSNSCAHEMTIPAFLIDLREVTVAQYAEAVASGAATAPPEYCDDLDGLVPDSDCDTLAFGPTGFDAAGLPMPDWLDRPVSCVRKTDARDYCSWRGGRLPLSTEWMKAARGASPSRREVPWAEEVPGLFTEWSRLPAADMALDHDGDHRPDCEGLNAAPPEPVTTRPENASPYGLLHVLGNVIEWVEVAATGDNYEQAGVDAFGFGQPDFETTPDPRISVGLPMERGAGELLTPISRTRALGFRCAYDP